MLEAVPMKRFVAIITCLALLHATAWAQQAEPAPPPIPPETAPRPPAPPQRAYPQERPAYPPPQQPTYAYPPQQTYAPHSGMLPGPEQLYRSGRRQRTVGMVLTFVGVGLGALGFALLYDAKYNHDNTTFDDVFESAYGLLFSIMGAGSFIPGVILWVNGAAKMDDALEMGAGGMTLAPAPRVAAAPGLTWTIRF
jgi:hypothetical protein